MTTDAKCLELDLAAYVDGELDPTFVAEVETHLADCSDCRRELNSQKQFLSMLDGGLRLDSEIELPADFARQVVTTAENNVAGLRRPTERFNAIFVIAALSLFALFAVGGESIGGVKTLIDQIVVVLGFLGQMLYSLMLGIVVVVRSFANIVPAGIGATLIFVALLIFGSFTFSLKFIRPRRA